MRFLLAPSLRPFVSLAAGTSLLLNLAMLVPSLYTLQVFDRVFASRSVETLVMLSALTVLALASRIVIANFDAGDQIQVTGLGGDDVIEASGVLAGGPVLSLDAEKATTC
ncbi:MAG TPA: hypothetical protein VF169_18890 [Albitalea sp.]|uniref:hypothetical protein n=1 Tax=Piscinibacter sp. TaxID=1903157 RepID=UPI002ED54C68